MLSFCRWLHRQGRLARPFAHSLRSATYRPNSALAAPARNVNACICAWIRAGVFVGSLVAESHEELGRPRIAISSREVWSRVRRTLCYLRTMHACTHAHIKSRLCVHSPHSNPALQPNPPTPHSPSAPRPRLAAPSDGGVHTRAVHLLPCRTVSCDEFGHPSL